MKISRFLALIFVLILTFGLFCGCGDSSDTSSSTSGATGTQTAGVDIEYLDSNGKAIYSIVRPTDSKMDEGSLAIAIIKQAKSVLGVTFKNVNDASDGTDKYEILVGNTNRPESAKALETLKAEAGGRFNDYIICVIDKKIVINAFNSDALKMAVDTFCNEFLNSNTVKNVYKIMKSEGDFMDIKINGENISKFKFVRPHYNTSYVVQKEIYEAIDSLTQKTGYRLSIVEDAYEAEGDYEIVIGDCNRKDVKSVSNVDEYYVTVSGKKVYINGGTSHALGVGVKEFTKLLTSSKELTDSSSFSGNYSTTVENYDKSKFYSLIWNDEFDGLELDTSKWNYIEYSGEGQNGMKSSRSRKIFHYDGSTMTMIPTKDETSYYGGMLYSDTKFTYKYGYLEISAKLPNAGGFWSSLWLCGKGHAGGVKPEVLLYPEIDVNESDGNGKAVAANCHSWPGGVGTEAGYRHTSCDAKYAKDKVRYALDGRSYNDDFHTFGFLWTDKEMTFTCDGEIYFTFDTTTCEQDVLTYNQHQFLIISLAVGLGHGSKMTTDESVWTDGRAEYSVDWVRLYQLDDGKSEVSNGFVY